jgi:predicted DNA-binding WGR domain protein
MPYFEFIGEDTSRKSEHAEKFWEITQVGKKVTVRFGKIGADGQLKVKDFDTKEDAEAEVAKLVKEKTKKGYIEKPNPHLSVNSGIERGVLMVSIKKLNEKDF